MSNSLEFIHEGAFCSCERLFRFELTNQIKEIEKMYLKIALVSSI